MDIDLTRLRYFVAVAEELHFKRAADRLHITPPPLSKQVKLLEQELGAKVFERHYHEVRLTPVGEALLPEARGVLDRVENLKAAIADAIAMPAPLQLGMTAFAPSDFLQRLEDALLDLAAPVLSAIIGSAADVTARLLSGHLDLGLIHMPVTDERLSTVVIGTYPGAVAVRADDPLAGRGSIRIEELADRELLIDFAKPNPQLLAWSIRQLNERGLTRLAHSSSGRASELELANQAYSRHQAVLISYAPDSFLGKMFSAPHFSLVKLDEGTWPCAELALAWIEERSVRGRLTTAVVNQLVTRLSPRRIGAPAA